MKFKPKIPLAFLLVALFWACESKLKVEGGSSIEEEVLNTLQNVQISNISSDGFDVDVETLLEPQNGDEAFLYYCNITKIPGCDPKNWYRLPMAKTQTGFSASSPVFKFPDDPKDEIKITVGATLKSVSADMSKTVQLDGPAQVYRSIGVGSTAALETRTSSGLNDAVIEGSRAVFDNNLADNIGIGDALVADTATAAGFEHVFFIRKRIDGRTFILNDKNGDLLTSDYQVLDWSVFRAYTSVPDSDALAENVGIPVEVRDFDTSRDAVADNRAWHFAFYADAVWNQTAKHDIGSWKLSGDNFLRYFVPFLPTEVGVSQRHSGTWDNSKATCSLVASGNYQWCFMQRGAGRNAVRIEGFQFLVDSNGHSNVYALRLDDYLVSAGGYAYVHNNIIKGSGAVSGNGGVSHAVGGDNLKLYLFANIAYGLGGTGFSSEGSETIVSHNTSFKNSWNFYGPNGSGASTFYSNISHSSGTYEFRFGGFSALSDYNVSENASAPGANALTNVLLSELSFVNTAAGAENLCVDNTSAAYFSGPKMIEEADPFKIYYDTAGNLRYPGDSVFPLGACSQ